MRQITVADLYLYNHAKPLFSHLKAVMLSATLQYYAEVQIR